ncbi:MAG: hypothetical protein ACREDK_01500 [Thermoplasmata archaeon]
MAIGEGADDAPVLREVRLRDLRPGLENAVITARVVRADRREVSRRADGGHRPVLTGFLTDGSATVRFTWWDPPGEELDPGVILRAARFTVREFRGAAELSFNQRTRIQPASESEIPSVPLDEIPRTLVGAVTDGDLGLRLEVRVVATRTKEVIVRGDRRTVVEGRMGDPSGSIAFTAWTDPHFAPGDAVRILGAQVRSFRGRVQLVLDERATITPLGTSDLPSAAELDHPLPQRIVALDAAGGGEHVRAEGVVVGLMPPSGLIYRCPTCRRATSNGHCRVHGAVGGGADLRARLVLDDGTGAMTVQADRAQTERLLGLTLDACLAELRRDPNPSHIEELLHAATFGRRLAVTGRASKDDFGLTFVPEEIVVVRPDPDRALAELRRRLFGGAA